MEFELTWLLVGLPVVFGAGWLASRLDGQQVRREAADSPKAYYKGLNLLLNEQQDKAIDAFIEAVQSDPDTTELHFALGNLFRRRGEFERAIRVHQHVLGRVDLPRIDRERAQHALAQDFMKAGLFDRAEQAYQALTGTRFDTEAQFALLDLYERSREWAAATRAAQSLEQAGAGSFAVRMAHHACEQALEADAKGQADEAAAALALAHRHAPKAPRAWVQAGQRAWAAGRAAEALEAWSSLRTIDPGAFRLIAPDFARAAVACGQSEAVRAGLRQAYAQEPGLDLLQALALLDGHALSQAPELVEHLRQQPSLSAAHAVLERAQGDLDAAALSAVRDALARAARPLQRYRCASCGFEAHRYFWQCPGCLSWDSFPTQRVEEL